MITNILTRIHAESKAESNPLKIQEGEIHKLAQGLGPTCNTIIPHTWIDSNPSLYQAHLERISDFLVHGPGVWRQRTSAGIEFFDGVHSPAVHPEGPQMHHVRSTSLADIDIYLQNKWENCCYGQIHLPANHIRQYQSDGSLNNIMMSDIQGTSQSVSALHVTPRTVRLVQVTPQPVNDAQTTPQPVSDAQITPQPVSDEQITPQPVSDAQITPQPVSDAQAPILPMRSTQENFKCTLTKAISQVLPVDSVLKQFDVLRNKVKQAKAIRSYEHKHFLDLSQMIKNSLISKYRELQSTIKTCECDWQRGDVVTSAGQPRQIRDLKHKLSIVKKLLLHEWKLDTAGLM